mmetsp:Transcript_2853/g.6601  ORF Transcript_2853/g.6601 Transcript_2853/m.6601 type:complete len:228 (+) Transcript_2853:563-1246(+)
MAVDAPTSPACMPYPWPLGPLWLWPPSKRSGWRSYIPSTSSLSAPPSPPPSSPSPPPPPGPFWCSMLSMISDRRWSKGARNSTILRSTSNPSAISLSDRDPPSESTSLGAASAPPKGDPAGASFVSASYSSSSSSANTDDNLLFPDFGSTLPSSREGSWTSHEHSSSCFTPLLSLSDALTGPQQEGLPLPVLFFASSWPSLGPRGGRFFLRWCFSTGWLASILASLP